MYSFRRSRQDPKRPSSSGRECEPVYAGFVDRTWCCPREEPTPPNIDKHRLGKRPLRPEAQVRQFMKYVLGIQGHCPGESPKNETWPLPGGSEEDSVTCHMKTAENSHGQQNKHIRQQTKTIESKGKPFDSRKSPRPQKTQHLTQNKNCLQNTCRPTMSVYQVG